MKRPGYLKIGSFQWNYPMSWNDMTRAELIAIFDKLTKYGQGPIYNLHLISICFGVNRLRSWFNKAAKYLIKGTDANTKITLVHNEEILGWMNNTKKNPMPYLLTWFCSAWRIYVGPHKRLNKLNVSEITFAMFYYQQYHKTKDEKLADYLIDVLYRPVSITRYLKRLFSSNPQGDIRVPLNDYMHHKRAKRHAKMSKAIKAIIIAQWGASQNEFAKKYKLAFRGTEKKSNPRDMAKFIIGAAGDKFGAVNEAEVAPADKIFEYVEMQLETMEKNKK